MPANHTNIREYPRDSRTHRYAGLCRSLLDWYRHHRRDLPWRRTRDPYRIWVSEVMLQQTQVVTVVPYYERFVARFPTVESLARAPIDEVLALWSGLGYYRRIRNLHEAARVVTEQYGGQLPADREALLRLPGVGRYTAGALLSIAFGRAEPVLDGNVIRILSRIYAIDKDVNASAVRERLWRLAADVVPVEAPADFNQALMELGATVCLPRKPLCLVCPVNSACLACKRGMQEALPVKSGRGRSEKRVLVSLLLESRGKLLLLQRDQVSLMDGLWELPTIEVDGQTGFESGPTEQAFLAQCGLRLLGLREVGRARHAITFRRITLHVCRATLSRRPASKPLRRACWIEPQDVSRFGVSSLTLKAMRFLEVG